MWRRASPAARWGLLVAIAALLLAALNVWWVLTYRHGYPFDIDEAGYTTFGLADYLGLKNGGLDGWWEAIQQQGTFAPLVPALTSLLVYVHPGVLNGFLTVTAFMVLLVLAVYGIASRLAGPKLGALAALVTATLPGTFAFSREYVYAMPTAAFLACAVFAVLRSDGMKRRRWAIACGAAIGLMLLSRTMAITYVPGVLAAAAVAIWFRRDGDLGGRILNLVLLALTAVAVAATWYTRNLGSVVEYLTSYGYRKQSQFYGRDHALLSWGRLRSVGEHMISEDLFLPMATVVLIGLVALAVVTFQRLRPAAGRRAALLRIAASDALSVSLVLLAGYAGLMSSQNGGNGFTFPLVALLPAVAVLALRQFPRAIKPAVAIVALIAVVNTISTATIWSTASHLRQVSLPGLSESFPITKGQPKAVFVSRFQLPGPETVFDSGDEQWLDADDDLARLLNGLYGPGDAPPLVAYATRNRTLNANTVQLATVSNYQRAMPLLQMEADPNDSVATYREQLTDPETGDAGVLITMNTAKDDFPPAVTQSRAVEAAKQLGFHRIKKLPLPDGRELYVWQKADGAATPAPTPSSRRSGASDSAPGNRRG